MRTIKRAAEVELDVKRSRFICAVERVADEEGARAFIAERRRRYWDATHNCTAYVTGAGGETQRSSDDGEPAGTAGVPMLEVLRRRELTGVAAVVTRYFGGTKLGAGGLVRAYGNAVSTAVERAGLLERRSRAVVGVLADYRQAGRLESELRDSRHQVRAVHYGADVEIEVAVAEPDLPEFRAWLAEVTGGDVLTQDRGTVTVEVEAAS
ncbi:putative YigZ family protein [Lipingzhangella halophila]|uniref:Putative YigZ family protein n=1 Tax=Lipingzhangella halophila TaxID=1783352 RepID=A0A7W7RLJ1_9ACTN|nr:YigZ family protein [Lipingzhangella halophila]MBB4934205.1 putative YigZ family protein [Lipingzhangella halophila]